MIEMHGYSVMVVALQLQTEQVGLDLPLFFAAINTIYEMEKSSSLVPSLSAPQIIIAYSLVWLGRGRVWEPDYLQSGRKRNDDACRNVTNLTSRISLSLRNFVPRHQSLVQTAPNSRTALSKAFTDTPTAIYPRKGTYMYA